MVRRSNNTLQYIALGILFVVTFGIQLRLSGDEFRALFSPQNVTADILSTAEDTNVIDWLNQQAERAGARIGDKILAVNERPYTGRVDYASELARSAPGSLIKLRVERGSEVLLLHVAAEAYTERAMSAKIILFIFRFLTPFFALGLGFFVAFQRPFDRLAWLVMALCISFSQVATGSSLILHAYHWDDGLTPVAIAMQGIWMSTWPVSMLLFGVYFPERSRLDIRWPWLKWVVVAPAIVIGFIVMLLRVLDAINYPAAAPILRFHEIIESTIFFAFAIPISGFFFQLGEKSGTSPSLDARRRLKSLWIGSTISLTPMFLTQLAALVMKRGFDSFPEWIIIPSLLLLFVFPLTLAYVIVVQRAMDVRMAVRTGIKYTLAQGGVRILRGIIIAGLIASIVYQLEARQMSLERRFVVITIGIVIIVRLRQAGEWLSKWVDRRFFREAYNSEQLLAELSENVRTIVETRPLMETVTARISELMHVPRIALLLHEGNAYQPAYALGYGSEPAVEFAESSAVVAELKKERRGLHVYLDDPESWTQSLDSSETQKLTSLKAEMLLPLAVKDKLHGFIALSQKQSEEPYSRDDVRLLQSVAMQTGLALENSQLTAAVANEVAQRERLNRELEIAREVQQRLFPQRSPAVAGLDYAGHCRPAQGVGGDYYDFIEVPDGHFGIAIGDISGKGIPAALLMASLQASLRGQTISSPTDLAGLMNNMNRLVFDASPSNRYATFFYGQYDPRTRMLTFVNGGHNSPMVFRGAEILRLEPGGPPVGLFAASRYTQSSICLEPGDILVAFTDGISEAMNHDDEEFGETGMMQVVRECPDFPSQLLLDRLFEAADAFAAGAPQHDDMTAVVIRVS